MKYDHPELRDRLAGEYVLGTLRGPARARFEGLLASDAGLRRLVREWEALLTPLAMEIPPVSPPASVFLGLKARLDGGQRDRTPTLWHRLGFWRALSAVALSAVLTLGILLGALQLRPGIPAGPSYVAVLHDESARPVLVVTAYNKPTWHADIEPLAPLAGGEGKVLRLWAVARGTGAIQPLATVATGAQRLALSEAGWKLVKGAESLTVTLETAGQAVDTPSGPLLYRGPCINLKGPAAS
jgi:anti-sigma-K factor RskA